jgi:hypothetical protein
MEAPLNGDETVRRFADAADGSMPDARHEPGGMKREARQRASLAKMVLYDSTHLANRAKRSRPSL